jgi:hypothetical protein
MATLKLTNLIEGNKPVELEIGDFKVGTKYNGPGGVNGGKMYFIQYKTKPATFTSDFNKFYSSVLRAIKMAPNSSTEKQRLLNKVEKMK